ATPSQAPPQVSRGPADHGDGRHRDGGAEPHHEGRRDARPEHALRQREHQHQNRPRAGPDPDGEDCTKTAPPAAGTGEFARSRTVRMAAMLVVDVVMGMIVPVVIMTVLMAPTRYMGV